MLPQRFLGRDLFWWLTRLGLITKTADSRLARRLRKKGDLVIGTRWRDLTRLGIQARPRLDDIDLKTAMFADGTRTKVAAVVWATGFRTDYSWLDIPGAVVDEEVANDRGVTPVPGLSIVGLPWLHTRGSALLGYVKDDAAWLAAHISDDLAAASSRAPESTCSSEWQVGPQAVPVPALLQVELGELAARGDPGLREDVPQVERDGPR